MDWYLFLELLQALTTVLGLKQGYDASSLATRLQVNESSLRKKFNDGISDLMLDSNRVNAMLEAARNKNNQLLLDLAYSSPVGSRIIQICNDILKSNNHIKQLEKEYQNTQDKVVKREKARDDAIELTNQINMLKADSRGIFNQSKKNSRNKEKILKTEEQKMSLQHDIPTDDFPSDTEMKEIAQKHNIGGTKNE